MWYIHEQDGKTVLSHSAIGNATSVAAKLLSKSEERRKQKAYDDEADIIAYANENRPDTYFTYSDYTSNIKQVINKKAQEVCVYLTVQDTYKALDNKHKRPKRLILTKKNMKKAIGDLNDKAAWHGADELFSVGTKVNSYLSGGDNWKKRK